MIREKGKRGKGEKEKRRKGKKENQRKSKTFTLLTLYPFTPAVS
jgi:hypothetical protein